MPVCADGLDPKTLLGWCQDARQVHSGITGMTLSQLDQQRSNGTACLGYLRGWLDQNTHIRAAAPLLGTCTAPDNNGVLLDAFWAVANEPGWVNLPIADGMMVFMERFCSAQQKIAPPVTEILAPAPQTFIQ